MTVENKTELLWNSWRNILLAEYDRRLGALGNKGYGIGSARKNFTAIFLQVNGFPVAAPDILLAVIKIIKQTAGAPPVKEYDNIAMIGHRIGMLENSADLKQYLQDIRPMLQPAGQILFTVLDSGSVNTQEHRSSPVLNFQQAALIGPFYNMSRIKADILKSQAAAANWQCEFLYRQDDSNYIARLRPTESL